MGVGRYPAQMRDAGSPELVVLGAGPAYTNRPGATGASYLLRTASDALLLDLGQGSFPALATEMEPSGLTGVVISHLHPDHFIDLVPLRHYLRFEFDPPRRVRVHAPADLASRLDALHAEPGFTDAALDILPLVPGCREVGGFEVEAARVTHTESSFGFRVSWGDRAALVYSGDCGRADDLVPLIVPGDTLLAEVSFGAGTVPHGAQHLDAAEVGQLAAATGVGRLLLTHIQMGYDRDEAVAAARRGFAGPVALVDPGYRTAL
jgi:ribonuclease BN (tRNA processing enzyme)